jgi:hypothetical protein
MMNELWIGYLDVAELAFSQRWQGNKDEDKDWTQISNLPNWGGKERTAKQAQPGSLQAEINERQRRRERGWKKMQCNAIKGRLQKEEKESSMRGEGRRTNMKSKPWRRLVLPSFTIDYGPPWVSKIKKALGRD